MPNWCYNILRVKGEREHLDEFLKFLYAEKTLFGRIEPYPDVLHQLDDLEKMFGALVPEHEEEYLGFVRGTLRNMEGSIVMRNLWAPEGYKELTGADLLELAQEKKYLERICSWSHGLGYNLAGYEWCISHWGTKWDIHTDEIERTDYKGSVKLVFDTAWSPPRPIILKLSIMFPNLLFNLRYFEQGMGFKGFYLCQSGEVLEDEEGRYRGSRGG